MKKLLDNEYCAVICSYWALILIICIICSFIPTHNTYPLTTQIIEYNKIDNTIICVDGTGNTWKFESTENWQNGDFLTLLMDDNKTLNNIYDDIIIMVNYAGKFES